jgi:POT family proton-dependent oligopeptide transporter
MTVSGTDATDRRERTFFGQPRVLANLFGVELWERFSFYGMQGILLIYLYYEASRGGLGIDEATATSIVGAYGGAVYLSTILGAWTADRLLGPERVLFASAILVMAGHIALAVLPGLAGVAAGLVLVAVGSGGVKANATSLVGSLYADDDPRRDAGFSLFYLGINVGALAGPLLTGLLQKNAGFHYGFGLAAVGMAIGLTQYTIGRRRLTGPARVVPNPLPPARRSLVAIVAAAAVVVVGLVAVSGVLPARRLATAVVVVSAIAAVAYFAVILSARTVTPIERRRMVGFIPMFLASAVFWSLYQQQFTVVTIYSDQRLDRTVLGWEMPVSWVQSINPVFIILLSGAFAALWTRLGRAQPSTPAKFTAGRTARPCWRSPGSCWCSRSPSCCSRRSGCLLPPRSHRPRSAPRPSRCSSCRSPWAPRCRASWPATTAPRTRSGTSARSAARPSCSAPSWPRSRR